MEKSINKSTSVWNVILDAFADWRNSPKIKDEELIGKDIPDSEFLKIAQNENSEVIKELMATRDGINIEEKEKKVSRKARQQKVENLENSIEESQPTQTNIQYRDEEGRELGE